MLFRGTLFAFFAHRKAEVSEFSSKGEVFSVRVGGKTALLEVELALAVDVALVNVNPNYLGEEHGVRSERLFLNDPAFEAYRTLLDYRSRDFVGGNGVKSAFFKLVDISSASHSAEIDLFAHCRGREIDDKFAGILYQTVGVAFGAHRYIQTIPVQAIVRTLGFSGVPQLTRAAGTGASSALPFQNCFDIFSPVSKNLRQAPSYIIQYHIY